MNVTSNLRGLRAEKCCLFVQLFNSPHPSSFVTPHAAIHRHHHYQRRVHWDRGGRLSGEVFCAHAHTWKSPPPPTPLYLKIKGISNLQASFLGVSQRRLPSNLFDSECVIVRVRLNTKYQIPNTKYKIPSAKCQIPNT